MTAQLVFAMNQSLDGVVDHEAFAPGPKLFRHFIDRVGSVAGALYGGRMYGIMRHWDTDREGWSVAEHDYARAWRAMPKRVASRSLDGVGPNATLLEGDLVAAVLALKETQNGRIDVAGPSLAALLGEAGLIDRYEIYLHPVVVGRGTPFFGGRTPPLRHVGTTGMDEGVVRIDYVPA